MTNSYYRDEIVRAALHAIDRGEPVSQAISDAVDSAMEFAALNAVSVVDAPLRDALGDDAFKEATFMVATRRQRVPPALPPERTKESAWWKI